MGSVKSTFIHVDHRTDPTCVKSSYNDDDLDCFKGSGLHQRTQTQFDAILCDRCEERDTNTQKYLKTGERLCTACMTAVNSSQRMPLAISQEIKGGPGKVICFYDHTQLELPSHFRQSGDRSQT